MRRAFGKCFNELGSPASLKLIRKTACPTSESRLFSSSLLLACPRGGFRLLMSPDPERRSIYYQDAGFPGLKRGRGVAAVSCLAQRKPPPTTKAVPASTRTNAKPPEMAGQRPFGAKQQNPRFSHCRSDEGQDTSATTLHGFGRSELLIGTNAASPDVPKTSALGSTRLLTTPPKRKGNSFRKCGAC